MTTHEISLDISWMLNCLSIDDADNICICDLYKQDMEPFTANASDRIKQFGDAMGVTDRYTGYRANLTRGTRDPFKMETKWVDPSGELGLMNSLTRSNTSEIFTSLHWCNDNS